MTMIEYWRNSSIVVTGAARGQGAAEVLRFMEKGATVVAVDVIPAADDVWAELRDHASTLSGRLVEVVADVATSEGWEDIACAVVESGVELRGLVNNAAVTLRKTLTNTQPDEWDFLMGVNLRGPYLGIRRLSEYFARGSSIVNVSSIAGMTGSFTAAYSVSKWALRGLSKSAAIELAHRDIRVNTVCPGLVDTPMTLTAHSSLNSEQSESYYRVVKETTPLRRGASPDEVAALVEFLVGPDSAFITGSDFPIDGGALAGGILIRAGEEIGLVTPHA